MRSLSIWHADRSQAVVLLVAGAFFMENLDGTVIATAIPSMAKSFSTTPAVLAIGMTAYLVTLAVVIPASGWAADRFGARRTFAAAIITFTLASALCGLSNNALVFTLSRVLQGCGGAMMTPVGRLVVLRGTAKSDLIRAVAMLTWPGLVAPVLGPPLGGFITDAASWRWIFFINLPLGLVGLVLTFMLMRDDGAGTKRPFDGTGFALAGFALGALLFAFDELGREGTDWRVALALIMVSAVAGTFATRHLRRSAHPLVDLAAFAIPSFRTTMASGTVSRTAISTMPFLLPLLFQLGLGLTPLASGLFVLWYGLANIGIKPATTPILRRFGFRSVLIANTLLNVLAIGSFALVGPDTAGLLIVVLLLFAGAVRSMQFTALNTLVFAEVPSQQTGSANVLFNVSFQLAIGMGIAVGAVALHSVEAVLGGASGHHATITAFRIVFLLAAALELAPLLGFLTLRHDAGAEVSGHVKRA